MITYIIAGSYREACSFIDNSTTCDYTNSIYVYNPDQLAGVHPQKSDFVFYGTWQTRPNAEEIREAVAHIMMMATHFWPRKPKTIKNGLNAYRLRTRRYYVYQILFGKNRRKVFTGICDRLRFYIDYPK